MLTAFFEKVEEVDSKLVPSKPSDCPQNGPILSEMTSEQTPTPTSSEPEQAATTATEDCSPIV